MPPKKKSIKSGASPKVAYKLNELNQFIAQMIALNCRQGHCDPAALIEPCMKDIISLAVQQPSLGHQTSSSSVADVTMPEQTDGGTSILKPLDLSTAKPENATKVYPCHDANCDKQFLSIGGRSKHALKCHSKSAIESAMVEENVDASEEASHNGTGSNGADCVICGKHFTNHVNYNRHLMDHIIGRRPHNKKATDETANKKQKTSD